MNRKGLTLLEVIIAITISALIMGILLSALRLGHRSQNKGTKRQEIAQRMRIITDRVSWLLRGAYPYTVMDEEGEETVYFSGGPRSVGLVTTSVDAYSDSIQDRVGLKWITLKSDGEGLKMMESIYFEKDATGDEGAATYVFDPTVKTIEFEYMDTADEKDLWVTGWDGDEKNYLPSAVRVTVVLMHEEEELHMPPFTVAIRTGHPKKERPEK
jgi:prepilin-type N-terminal cleavage/methylation domain-containing protein